MNVMTFAHNSLNPNVMNFAVYPPKSPLSGGTYGTCNALKKSVPPPLKGEGDRGRDWNSFQLMTLGQGRGL